MSRLIYTIILVLLLSVLIGCKSRPSYVPVESLNVLKEHSERAGKDSTRIIEKTTTKDSIIIRDSIVYKVGENGNIISKEVYQWRERYRESNYLLKQLQSKYDSLLHIKQDSVRTEVPYPVEVKGDTIYKMKWYEEIVFYIGLAALAIGGLYGGFRILKRKFF